MAKKSKEIVPEKELDLEAAPEKETPVAAVKAEPVAAPKNLPGIWKRVSPAEIYPPLMKKLEQLVANCEARGARYYATSGLRTWESQAALYAQGRSKPGKIVTNAKPGQSSHQFAIAVDFCRDADLDREGLQPDWDLDSYEILAEEAKKLGLESAFYWKSFKEGPHVQLNLARNGLDLAQLRSIFLSGGGLKAVFHLLDKYQW